MREEHLPSPSGLYWREELLSCQVTEFREGTAYLLWHLVLPYLIRSRGEGRKRELSELFPDVVPVGGGRAGLRSCLFRFLPRAFCPKALASCENVFKVETAITA